MGHNSYNIHISFIIYFIKLNINQTTDYLTYCLIDIIYIYDYLKNDIYLRLFRFFKKIITLFP